MVIIQEGEAGNGTKVEVIKKQELVGTKEGGVKNSIGNGVAKELRHTTHGHELRGGDC